MLKLCMLFCIINYKERSSVIETETNVLALSIATAIDLFVYNNYLFKTMAIQITNAYVSTVLGQLVRAAHCWSLFDSW